MEEYQMVEVVSYVKQGIRSGKMVPKQAVKNNKVDPDNPKLCRSKGGIQLFVQITDNIILNQWGSDMKIASGGYINITNVDDMYGISQRDFEDTYIFTTEKNKTIS